MYLHCFLASSTNQTQAEHHQGWVCWVSSVTTRVHVFHPLQQHLFIIYIRSRLRPFHTLIHRWQHPNLNCEWLSNALWQIFPAGWKRGMPKSFSRQVPPGPFLWLDPFCGFVASIPSGGNPNSHNPSVPIAHWLQPPKVSNSYKASTTSEVKQDTEPVQKSLKDLPWKLRPYLVPENHWVALPQVEPGKC